MEEQMDIAKMMGRWVEIASSTMTPNQHKRLANDYERLARHYKKLSEEAAQHAAAHRDLAKYQTGTNYK